MCVLTANKNTVDLCFTIPLRTLTEGGCGSPLLFARGLGLICPPGIKSIPNVFFFLHFLGKGTILRHAHSFGIFTWVIGQFLLARGRSALMPVLVKYVFDCGFEAPWQVLLDFIQKPPIPHRFRWVALALLRMGEFNRVGKWLWLKFCVIEIQIDTIYFLYKLTLPPLPSPPLSLLTPLPLLRQEKQNKVRLQRL